MDTLFPMLLVGVIFYFLMIRPAQKRQKETTKMLDALKTGDNVVTSGGIHGRIAGIQDNVVTIKIADNVKIKVDRAAVGRVDKKNEKAEKQEKAEKSGSSDKEEKS